MLSSATGVTFAGGTQKPPSNKMLEEAEQLIIGVVPNLIPGTRGLQQA